MAERRMFAKSIAFSDVFTDLPATAVKLYFYLGLSADDDGFIGNPKAIMRQCNTKPKDLKILLEKRFLLGFESGAVVIKHWKINNIIKNDRYKPTTYLEEKALLKLDEKGAYTEKEKPRLQNGTEMEPERNHSTGKVRLEEVRLGEINKSNQINSFLDKSGKKAEIVENSVENPSIYEVQEYILSTGRQVNVNHIWQTTKGMTEYNGKPVYNWKGLVDHWCETEQSIPYSS